MREAECPAAHGGDGRTMHDFPAEEKRSEAVQGQLQYEPRLTFFLNRVENDRG